MSTPSAETWRFSYEIQLAPPHLGGVVQRRTLLSCGDAAGGAPHSRGLHSSTFQLNASTFCGIRWVDLLTIAWAGCPL
jgi:hypothetical protein